jgi:hypothetical protein
VDGGKRNTLIGLVLLLGIGAFLISRSPLFNMLEGAEPSRFVPLIAGLGSTLVAVIIPLLNRKARKALAETDVTPGSRFSIRSGVEKPGKYRVVLRFAVSHKGRAKDYGIRCQVDGSVNDQKVFWRDFAIGDKAPGGVEKNPKFLSKQSISSFRKRKTIGAVLLGHLEVKMLYEGMGVSGRITVAEGTDVESLKVVIEK